LKTDVNAAFVHEIVRKSRNNGLSGGFGISCAAKKTIEKIASSSVRRGIQMKSAKVLGASNAGSIISAPAPASTKDAEGS